jgi:hypothetical protein
MTAFAGFDTFGYPGDSAMDWLKKNTNLTWVGFYLGPAPSHPNANWMPHRERLVETGWGLAPIYVGQQTQGPGRHVVTAAQGSHDGANAVQLLMLGKFPKGSFVYLDLENGRPFTPAQKEYVHAWVGAVEKYGYGAGVYCSFTFAGDVHELVPSARIWAFHVPTTRLHNVAGKHFPDMHPAGSGYAGATMWQCAQNCKIVGNLTVDLDTSVLRDPSAPNEPTLTS